MSNFNYRLGRHFCGNKSFTVTAETKAKDIKKFLKLNPEFKKAILLNDNTTEEHGDDSKISIKPGQSRRIASDNDNAK